MAVMLPVNGKQSIDWNSMYAIYMIKFKHFCKG